MKNLILFLPSFYNNLGHENAFIDLYKKIAKRKKHTLFLIIPKNNNLKIYGKVYKIIPNINYNNFFIYKLIKSIIIIFKFPYKLLQIIKKIDHNSSNSYLIDGSSFFYFPSLITLFFFIKKQKKLFIYCRENLARKTSLELIFFIFTKLCHYFFESVVILTDNQPLTKQLKKKYKTKVLKLPIPHAQNNKNINMKFNNVLWLPGPFREDKGRSNIIKFLINNENDKFFLKLNKNFNLVNKKIIVSPNSLTQKKYISFFKKVSIVILPYSCPSYKYRSSAIFVECISLEKLVFVSDDTWMAEELKKFKLKELIVKDWSDTNYKNMKNIFFDKKINNKIKKMSKYYKEFCSKENFVRILGNEL